MRDVSRITHHASSVVEEIRDAARQLLADDTVDFVIGYGAGTLPEVTRPVFLTSPDQVDQLVWNARCGANLSVYLARAREDGFKRIAVVVKPCEIRNVIELVKENQCQREEVKLIGVQCWGMLSRRKLRAAAGARDVLEVAERDEGVLLSGRNGSIPLGWESVLRDVCLGCAIGGELSQADIAIVGSGNRPDGGGGNAFSVVTALELLSTEDRWAYFVSEFSRCLRCNACRNACPMCYCKECFAERSAPRWVGPSVAESDILTYHLIRALHQAGRCSGCGACAEACPVGINVRLLTQKLEKDAQEFFGYQAGGDAETPALLADFKPDDAQPFIHEGHG